MRPLQRFWQWLGSDATNARTVRAVFGGLFFSALLLVLRPEVRNAQELWRLPWAALPGLTGAAALSLAVVWPSATRLAYNPEVRRGPRRSDLLAHLGLCLCAVLAAWAIQGQAEILAACAVGVVLGLAPHGVQALQMAWGLPLTCMNGKPAGRPEMRLPQTPGNVLRAAVSAALAPFGNVNVHGAVWLLMPSKTLMSVSAGMAGPYTEAVWGSALVVYAVTMVMQLGFGLRWSLRDANPAALSVGYGVAAGLSLSLAMPEEVIPRLTTFALTGCIACAWLLWRLNGDAKDDGERA